MSRRCGKQLRQFYNCALSRICAGIGREHWAVETIPRIRLCPAGRRAQLRLIQLGVRGAGGAAAPVAIDLEVEGQTVVEIFGARAIAGLGDAQDIVLKTPGGH